jgi:hypothetical protein
MTPRTMPFIRDVAHVKRKERKGISAQQVRQNTYHLELVLPKLFFLGLIKEWEVSDMVDKNIP